MVIPRVGIEDGKVVVEGGGVKFEAPISDAPSAGVPIITIGGRRFRSIPRGGGGGGRSAPVIPTGPSQADIQAEAQRRAEEQRLIEETRRIGRERLEQEAKREQIRQATAVREQQRIEAERQRIISAGGQVTTKTSRDVRTGRELIITETKGRGGRKIRDVQDIEKGTTKTTTFAPPRGGGAVRQTGGITTKEIQPVVEPRVDIPATGEVQPAPEKGFFGNIISFFSRSKTKGPLRDVISRENVKGGVVESRLIENKDGIPSTFLVFIPSGGGSERTPTSKQEEEFRDKQLKVTAITRPDDILGGLAFDVSTQRKIIQTQRIRGEGAGGVRRLAEDIFIGGFGAGVATSLIGSAQFVQAVVTDPIGTARGAEKSIIQLAGDVGSGKAFRDIALTVKTNPAFALGFATTEIATDVALGLAVSKGLRTLPRPVLRTLAIQQLGGDDVLVRALGIETRKGRGLVLGGRVSTFRETFVSGLDIDLSNIQKGTGIFDIETGLIVRPKDTGGKFFLGTADISDVLERLPTGAEIKIASVLETKIIKRSLKLSEFATTRAKEIITPFQQVIRGTLKTKTKFLDIEQLTSATERLPKAGVKVILDIAEQEKGVLFGSKARAFQLSQKFDIGGEKFILDKVPRDIELRFDLASVEKLQDITELAIEKLKKVGDITEDGKLFELTTAREIADSPFTVEAKVGGTFQKVAEFKGDVDLLDVVPEFVVGFKKTGKPIKVGRIKATGLPEELRGVSQGILRVRKDIGTGLLDIIPAEKRLKDIGSFSVTARTLLMSEPEMGLKAT